ncbi:efflux RND transporter periplasmic adaptor subunit [Vibrio astriarenae]|uniref:efflux RND transporter periplasmic adaptor subunit n=1 Tax=Vibrio astriarenae TaxID=1481923 RepID=UPI0037366E55
MKLTLVTGLLIAGLIVPPISKVNATQLSASARALPVELSEVKSSPWGESLVALGNVYARHQVALVSQVEGVITGLPIHDTQTVSQGQLLVQLDDRQAKALLAQADAQLNEDKRLLKEMVRLHERNSLPESSLLTQRAKVQISQAQRDSAAVTLSYYQTTAPFDGVTGLNTLTEGQYVQRGESLITLTDVERLYIDFNLPSHYLSQLNTKQKLELRFNALPDRVFFSEISSIDPQIDQQSRNLKVRAELFNPEGLLRPGLLAQINVSLEQEIANIVPTSAVFYRGANAYLYVVDADGIARQTEVTLGNTDGALTQVLAGVPPGAHVVSAGVGKISHGSLVKDANRVAQLKPEAQGDDDASL